MVHVKQETVTIPKKEYELLKKQSNIDVDLLRQLIASFKAIKQGRVTKVR